MADTRAKLTLNGGTTAELDVLKGTLGQDVIDIRTLGSKDVLAFDPGFTSTTSCESKITFIDGGEGILLHRGFPIDQLATDSSYLEVCYILSNGEKPTQEQYDEFRITVTRHTMIHEQITRLFRAFRRDSHPMIVMCGITGALATFYHDSLDVNNPRHRGTTALRLLPKMLTITVMCYKYSVGQPFAYPRNDLSYADNFLNMMFSTPYEPYEVNPVLEHTMGRVLILHADHGQNAFISTMRTVGSSDANPFACIAADIASLWGPAHGGTNEVALKMLEEISPVKRIPELVRRAKDKSDSFRLMDFGHRVYENYNPRVTIMHEICHEALGGLGTKDDLLEVAMELESIVLNDPYFVGKKLCPNVDFYSDIILEAVSIPSFMLTVVFTMAHMVDWIAHWSEMHGNGMRITRSHQLYTGYKKRSFRSDIKHWWLITKPFTFQTHP